MSFFIVKDIDGIEDWIPRSCIQLVRFIADNEVLIWVMADNGSFVVRLIQPDHVERFRAWLRTPYDIPLFEIQEKSPTI